MHHTIDVLSSLQRPRKIVVTASDGKEYAFLCKPKDDLRKDARLMEFDAMINNLLQSNSESRKRRLCKLTVKGCLVETIVHPFKRCPAPNRHPYLLRRHAQ